MSVLVTGFTHGQSDTWHDHPTPKVFCRVHISWKHLSFLLYMNPVIVFTAASERFLQTVVFDIPIKPSGYVTVITRSDLFVGRCHIVLCESFLTHILISFSNLIYLLAWQ